MGFEDADMNINESIISLKEQAWTKNIVCCKSLSWPKAFLGNKTYKHKSTEEGDCLALVLDLAFGTSLGVLVVRKTRASSSGSGRTSQPNTQPRGTLSECFLIGWQADDGLNALILMALSNFCFPYLSLSYSPFPSNNNVQPAVSRSLWPRPRHLQVVEVVQLHVTTLTWVPLQRILRPGENPLRFAALIVSNGASPNSEFVSPKLLPSLLSHHLDLGNK